MRSAWRHIRAAACLAVIVWMVILGFPGLDRLRPQDYVGEKRQKLLDGGLAGRAELMVGDLDRLVRRPLAERLEWTQRVPRVSHSWHLYRDGPGAIRRLEIWVDDELWFRSQDAEHTWRKDQLTMRKFRPMVSTTASDPRAQNWRGMVRWVAREAAKDKPSLQEVRVQGVKSRFPDGDKVEVKLVYTAGPPSFEPRKVTR